MAEQPGRLPCGRRVWDEEQDRDQRQCRGGRNGGYAGLYGDQPWRPKITILANQGAISAVRDLAAGFEQATGNKVIVSFEAGTPSTRS